MKTVDELIAAWDRGETIWTLEMGGLGPGYEQAIQVTAVEFARAGKSMPRTEDKQEDYKSFNVICDKALERFDDQLGGITGAMCGAAKWLAWQWCFEGGPEALVARAQERGEDKRLIQCSNKWPKV